MPLLIDDLTPPDRPTDVCPDPWTHARYVSQREQTWRQPVVTPEGVCGWCGKRLELPPLARLVGALPTATLDPLHDDTVEGNTNDA